MEAGVAAMVGKNERVGRILPFFVMGIPGVHKVVVMLGHRHYLIGSTEFIKPKCSVEGILDVSSEKPLVSVFVFDQRVSSNCHVENTTNEALIAGGKIVARIVDFIDAIDHENKSIDFNVTANSDAANIQTSLNDENSRGR